MSPRRVSENGSLQMVRQNRRPIAPPPTRSLALVGLFATRLTSYPHSAKLAASHIRGTRPSPARNCYGSNSEHRHLSHSNSRGNRPSFCQAALLRTRLKATVSQFALELCIERKFRNTSRETYGGPEAVGYEQESHHNSNGTVFQ